MTQLTPHFSFEELTRSDTAVRLGIDNDPPLEVVAALKRTAAGMERVRAFLSNNAISISSGFRCEALEKQLTYKAYLTRCRLHNIPVNDRTWAEYFARKSHPRGEAVDFTCSTQGTPRQLVARIKDSDIPYDQLICEFDAWAHISFSDRNRREVLIIDNMGTRPWTP